MRGMEGKGEGGLDRERNGWRNRWMDIKMVGWMNG